MTNVAEKMGQLIQKLAAGEDIKLEVNMVTGGMRISGVEFTAVEQLELINEFGNDPTMAKLMAQINKTPEAKEVRKAVSFNAGNFEVDADKVAKAFGIKLDSAKHIEKGVEVVVKDAKDREIERLQAEILKLQLEKAVEEVAVTEEDLTYPADFYNSFEDTDSTVEVKELTDEEIQGLVDSLKVLEVPGGSFVSVRLGDTVAIKLNDGNSITYIASSDYYIAEVE